MVRSRGKPSTTKKRLYFALSKGFYGRPRNCWRLTQAYVNHKLEYMTEARAVKKRDMKRAWTVRINAAVREHGMNYNNFRHGLVLANVTLDRKMLSYLAVHEPTTFRSLVQLSGKFINEPQGLRAILPGGDASRKALDGVMQRNALEKGLLIA